MPRETDGGFTLPNPPFQAGTPALAARMNENLADLAEGIAGSLARDGRGAMLNDLDAGGHRLVDLAAGTDDGDAPRLDQVAMVRLALVQVTSQQSVSLALPAAFRTFRLTFERVLATAYPANGLRVTVPGATSYVTAGTRIGPSGLPVSAFEASSSGQVGGSFNPASITNALSGEMLILPGAAGHLPRIQSVSHFVDHNGGGARFWNQANVAVICDGAPGRAASIALFFGGAAILSGEFALYGIR